MYKLNHVIRDACIIDVFVKLPTFTPAGFDLTTHSSVGGDYTRRPARATVDVLYMNDVYRTDKSLF
jgi:hypothetical protein